MTKPTVIRFEATDIDPTVSDDLGLLVMETVDDGRIAIHMQRSVFVALFEQMRVALEQSDAPSDYQLKA